MNFNKMGNWKTYKLGDISKDIAYGYTASATTEPLGTKFLRITDIQGGSVNWNDVPYCEIDDQKKGQYQLEIGDIVIARTGNSTGENTIIRDDVDAVFASYLIRYQIDEKIVFPFYVAYCLRSQNWRNFVQSIKGGSAQAGANAKQFARFEFDCPESIEEQKAIAKILSSLDDKIELNRRMNATLEAMAKALFKAWFVDFEPVRANMENRPSESASPEIAKLFPSEFENDIPKGWRIGTLNEISFNYRQNVNPNEVEAETPYVGLEHIPKKSIALTEWGNSEKAESTKSSFKSNDILFGKLRPYFHKVVIAPFDGICSTDILVIRPKDNYHFGQILITYSSDEIIQYADRLSNGAKMPRTNWSDLAKFEVVIPTKQISEEFSIFTASIAEKIKLNISENQKLAEIRDSLLPRLISGKIRCSELRLQA